MHKLVAEYLCPWKDKLPTLYDWDFDLGRATSEFGLSFGGSTSFERTLELKSGLRQLVRGTDCPIEHGRVATYFVKVWGGITRFSKVDETLALFSHIKGSTAPPVVYNPPFKMISSWSKWASIVCPDWACIYDARVAYSLNAINFLAGAKHPIFPMPEGRNSRLKMLDVSTLLLSEKLGHPQLHVHGASDPKTIRRNHFIPEHSTYAAYVSLVSKVSQDLWADSNHIHEVEMLLFSLADTGIYADVFNRLSNSAVK